MPTVDDVYAAIRNADAAGDTASVQKLGAYLKTLTAPTQPAAPVSTVEAGSPEDNLSAGLKPVGNLVAGAVRGAGSIGATILAPVDATARFLNGGKPVTVGGYDIVGQDRRSGMDAGLTELGADPNSTAFKAGKIAGEVAGTSGAGGLVAKGAQAVGAAPALVDAIASGGFAGGGNALTRAAGGAINGAATAGLVNPADAGKGAVIGGVLPGAVELAGKAGNAIYGAASDAADSLARKWMQSALKPTLAQRTPGAGGVSDADTAIQTLLDRGINPTKSGVNKLKALIDDLNTQISDKVNGSTATVDKQKVLDALDQVRTRFATQVSPTKDLNAIQGVADDFAAHPALPTSDIPVQVAQDMKQGTYRVLSGKYGEAGSAETEAQKGLARGLKEEIATAVPGVGPLNAEESKLLTTLSVTERRALLEANKNPMGLSLIAHNPMAWAAFMADRSGAFKALAARMAYNAVPAAGNAGQRVLNAASNPLLRATGLEAVGTNP